MKSATAHLVRRHAVCLPWSQPDSSISSGYVSAEVTDLTHVESVQWMLVVG